MKKLLYLLPFLILGCDVPEPTTAPKPNSSPATTKAPEAQAKDTPKVEPPKEEAKNDADPKEDPPEEAPPIPESFKPLNKAKTIFFEKKADGTRLVHLLGYVCLREGPLEVLVCKKESKEHESILHVDADGREIHAALTLAGAKAGTPVKFAPKYTPATGTTIKISLTYRMKGKVMTTPANFWINDKKTGKDMAHDWVFAGSKLFQDPDRPEAPPYYMANNGEFVSLANFPDSMLDLPVKSSKDAADLVFDMKTKAIPPLKTPVIITLEPVLDKK